MPKFKTTQSKQVKQHVNPVRTADEKRAQRQAARLARLAALPLVVNRYDHARAVAFEACGIPCGWVHVGKPGRNRRSFEPASSRAAAGFIDSGIIRSEQAAYNANRVWAGSEPAG